MKLNAHVRFRGEFRYEVREEGQVVREGKFPNLITNFGLDMIGNEAPTYGPLQLIMAYCSVGTDNTAADVTDTALGGFVAAVDRLNAASAYGAGAAPDYAVSYTQTFEFPVGTFSGQTIAELGIGKSDDGTDLWARALITDDGGTPTTIVLTAASSLTVYYTVYTYPPISDVVADLDYNGDDTTYNYRVRAIAAGSYTYWAFTGGGVEIGHLPTTGDTLVEISAWSGDLAALTAFTPAGVSNNGFMLTQDAYIDGQYYIDAEIWFPSGSGNFGGGIGAFLLTTTLGSFQFRRETNAGAADPVVKTAAQTLTIGLRLSWGRYT